MSDSTANPDREMSDFDTFMSLIRHGDVDNVLSTFRTEYLAMTKDDDFTPLHVACENGHLELVRFLCEQKCDIDVPTSDDYTPLHLACKNGHVAIVEYLCQQKCDIEAVAIFESRPIHVAVLKGHIDIVRYLCQQQCDLEAVTENGKSVLDLAIKNRRHDIHKVLSDESSKRQLILKIANMKMDCDDLCDHSYCLKNNYCTMSESDAMISLGNFSRLFKMKDLDLNYTYCMKSTYRTTMRSIEEAKYIEFDINKYLHVLRHERIVQYFGSIQNGQHIYTFMEYVEGISLDKHINQKSLPHNKVIQYSKEILEGLKFLHQNKIIHRKIKPPNIMINNEDHVKLCDFGLSRYLESMEQSCQIQTADSSSYMSCCGTPYYMAPEIVKGCDYSYPVDIWALGITVVEMLTGERPFHGLETLDVLLHLSTEQKIEFVPAETMSEDMKSFVDQMLCPSPSSRATAEVLLNFIDEKFPIAD